MSGTQRLKVYEVTYLHHAQRDLNAMPVADVGGQFLHKTLYSACTELDAVQHFRDIGGSVLSVTPVKRKPAWLSGASRSLKLQILQSIAFNCKAGLSPVRAFEQVATSTQGDCRLALNDGLRAMQQGASFSDAIELMNWYDESTIAVLRTGESTGQLSRAIYSAVAHYSRSAELIKILIGTVVFTAFDLFMAVSSIVGIRFGLIPSVAEQGITTENPEAKLAFERSLELATTVNDLLLLGTGLVIGAVVFVVGMLFSPNPKHRAKAAHWMARVPVLGPLLENAYLSNALTILSSLIENGVRIASALVITVKATRHEGCLIYLRHVQDELGRGVPLRQAFAAWPLSIPEKIVVQSCNDGEQLAYSMKNIAQSREDIGKSLAKRFAVLALITSLGYSGIAVGFSLWVVYIQNSALLPGGS